jgi:hypothetical protein
VRNRDHDKIRDDNPKKAIVIRQVGTRSGQSTAVLSFRGFHHQRGSVNRESCDLLAASSATFTRREMLVRFLIGVCFFHILEFHWTLFRALSTFYTSLVGLTLITCLLATFFTVAPL